MKTRFQCANAQNILLRILFLASLSFTAHAGFFDSLVGAPKDFAKLDDFHDPSLEGDSSVVDFKAASGKNGVWQSINVLGKKGLGKVFIRTPPVDSPKDKKGYAGYAPGYYEVTVRSAGAKNLNWEVWNSNEQYQFHGGWGSTDIHFKKILGPFKADELVKLDFLKEDKPDSYGYIYRPRSPLIVVYSPSETGEEYSVEIHNAKAAEE